eukprot:5212125-Pyramimonas_sp.AAC.1
MPVPLHVPFTEQLAEAMRAAIATIVPFFAQIQVVSTLVYLGLVMGAAADESSCWLAPFLKVKFRSKMVGAAPLRFPGWRPTAPP